VSECGNGEQQWCQLIVGKGLHNHDQIARIKIAVVRVLETRGFVYQELEANSGVVCALMPTVAIRLETPVLASDNSSYSHSESD